MAQKGHNNNNTNNKTVKNHPTTPPPKKTKTKNGGSGIDRQNVAEKDLDPELTHEIGSEDDNENPQSFKNTNFVIWNSFLLCENYVDR